MDYRNTGWFSGFADGEGCFLISRHSVGKGYALIFATNLRADEKPILSKLQECFGGNLTFIPVSNNQRRRTPGANPSYKWKVSARVEVLRLIEYFDAFPPQAKKAIEYKVWREAALFYYRYSGGQGKTNPQWLCNVMEDFKVEIERLREYEAQPLEPGADTENIQLSLEQR